MEFDLFISHASEDKTDFVRPLAARLNECGFRLWYDEFTLRLGDSLTECIDYGLRNSEVGLLVLSKAFMGKAWPKRELAGLAARQIRNSTRLIPIWHHVDIDDVVRFSPPLADIKAMSSTAGIDSIVLEISRVVPMSSPSPFPDRTIEEAHHAIERGDDALAIEIAFVAFDRRMIRLIDHLREGSVLPPDYRIPRYPGAAWEAVGTLVSTGRLNIPSEIDLEFLRFEMESSIGRWSLAAHLPPTREQSERVVSQVTALLRANPLIP